MQAKKSGKTTKEPKGAQTDGQFQISGRHSNFKKSFQKNRKGLFCRTSYRGDPKCGGAGVMVVVGGEGVCEQVVIANFQVNKIGCLCLAKPSSAPQSLLHHSLKSQIVFSIRSLNQSSITPTIHVELSTRVPEQVQMPQQSPQPYHQRVRTVPAGKSNSRISNLSSQSQISNQSINQTQSRSVLQGSKCNVQK